ncbi:hemoglobin [Sinobacterium caligoides]|uniref:Hemoglobin n=1 Tax=Sinobacterium caligoides TaxID=933926 RepID=A0A3N2DZX4_9GAMM|nr:group III truncated hemoglobin [Sinobacterium caligoides]ROS04989.1 hemoglobin [Sinobacterium caligoides]
MSEVRSGLKTHGQCRGDVDSTEQVSKMVELFYLKVLSDPVLRPIFVDTAQIDLSVHLPHIKAYWSKLLLGTKDYQRHTMNIHRALDNQQRLSKEHFERWLELFVTTVQLEFEGPNADRAVRLASTIADNMHRGLEEGDAPKQGG